MSKKLQGTLYTLLHLYNQIDLFFKAAIELNSKVKEWNPVISDNDPKMTLDKVAIPACTNNIFILAVSFLDEWNDYFTPKYLPTYSDRVLKVKRITKPALKRIAKWKDLKNGRNIIFAHNFRVKGQDIFTSTTKHNLKFPMNNTEVSLLHDLIMLMSDELLDEFTDIEIDSQRSILDGVNFQSEQINSHEEIIKIFDEIATIKIQEFKKQNNHLKNNR